MKIIKLLTIFIFFLSRAHAQNNKVADVIIARGQMPNIAKDKNNHIHIVYGAGDSIMYTSSGDGISFRPPSLVAVLPLLFSSAMRGPQIAAAGNGLVITACTRNGNIFSYKTEPTGKWAKAIRVNDINGVAKEALMALSADGLNVYAVWLGVKGQKGQNVYGARSLDGGSSWTKNTLVYKSPDHTVCECCKPSIARKGNIVYVMFRNQRNGSRDLYLIKSTNGGKIFGQAQKLGEGTWKLNGCPMDGGGIAVDKDGIPQTVWRREGKIFAATPGAPEKEIGQGRNCSIETIQDKIIYAWTENGNVVIVEPRGIKRSLGKGSLPLVKALNNENVICVWENDKEIHTRVLKL